MSKVTTSVNREPISFSRLVCATCVKNKMSDSYHTKQDYNQQ